MTNSIEELKEKRPDLVDKFENLSKEELLKQCYLEAMDSINMSERVQLFMNECTISMSKTTYTLESIQKMIDDKKEYDVNFFCFGLLSSDMSGDDIIEEVKERANKIEM